MIFIIEGTYIHPVYNIVIALPATPRRTGGKKI